MNNKKLDEALSLLKLSLAELQNDLSSKVNFAAVAKAYEVSFEYTWKSFKREADNAGMEVYSPRDSLKAAAQLGLIEDLELWDKFLTARNLSVHDYVGLSDEKFLSLVKAFLQEVKFHSQGI